MGRKEVGEEEIEKEIAEMAERVSFYRSTLPRHLLSLPPPPPYLSPFSPPEGVPLVEEDQETTERAKVLKQKISHNISAVPVLLKRMKNVISRLDKLDSCKIVVPPVYKKKRMN